MTPLRTLLDRREGAVLMGILNRTPDSFSDGGRFMDDGAALAYVETMIREGAAIVDVGAESTRPGAARVSDAEQLARLGDVVKATARRGALVSIDTTSPAVAEHALRDGAHIVNSTSLEPAARFLGARRCRPLTARRCVDLDAQPRRRCKPPMCGFSDCADDAYGDVVADVARASGPAAAESALQQRARGARAWCSTPASASAKTRATRSRLCQRLDELVALGFPVLVGPSRKSFITRAAGDEPPAPPSRRLGGSLAAAIACVEKGATIVRTHDVLETRQALAVAGALRTARPSARALPMPSGAGSGEERPCSSS